MSESNCNCTDAYRLLAELLDGDCCAATREQLRRELSQCPHCAERLGSEEAVRYVLRRSCSEQAPVRLRQRISIRISRITEIS